MCPYGEETRYDYATAPKYLIIDGRMVIALIGFVIGGKCKPI